MQLARYDSGIERDADRGVVRGVVRFVTRVCWQCCGKECVCPLVVFLSSVLRVSTPLLDNANAPQQLYIFTCIHNTTFAATSSLVSSLPVSSPM